MTYEEKYFILTEEGLATEEEISLVTSINGYTEEQLENILFVRTGYTSFEKFVYYEVEEPEEEEEEENDDVEYNDYFMVLIESLS